MHVVFGHTNKKQLLILCLGGPIPDGFWMQLHIDQCLSLPCIVTATCSFILTTNSFHSIALFNFNDSMQIYFDSPSKEEIDDGNVVSVLSVSKNLSDTAPSQYDFNLSVKPCGNYWIFCRAYGKRTMGAGKTTSGRLAPVPFPREK